ncbi:MAG TPA: Asp-tRNA(Asn)/Glu-tRNA(Gln) amidotransferase subunit GatC [Oceanospirillales bacterium]|nr:Asp-tRNA(Asn)/Glu-tRNA(Gln) amidotransferase subunit GatC [Oceanospirillales bacterium]
MLINRKEVEQIAVLAKLEVNAAEIENITQSLDAVVNMINHINEVDTKDVKPMANPLDAVQRLRADVVTETSNKEVLLALAANADEDYYLVPTVIE